MMRDLYCQPSSTQVWSNAFPYCSVLAGSFEASKAKARTGPSRPLFSSSGGAPTSAGSRARPAYRGRQLWQGRHRRRLGRQGRGSGRGVRALRRGVKARPLPVRRQGTAAVPGRGRAGHIAGRFGRHKRSATADKDPQLEARPARKVVIPQVVRIRHGLGVESQGRTTWIVFMRHLAICPCSARTATAFVAGPSWLQREWCWWRGW